MPLSNAMLKRLPSAVSVRKARRIQKAHPSIVNQVRRKKISGLKVSNPVEPTLLSHLKTPEKRVPIPSDRSLCAVQYPYPCVFLNASAESKRGLKILELVMCCVMMR